MKRVSRRLKKNSEVLFRGFIFSVLRLSNKIYICIYQFPKDLWYLYVLIYKSINSPYYRGCSFPSLSSCLLVAMIWCRFDAPICSIDLHSVLIKTSFSTLFPYFLFLFLAFAFSFTSQIFHFRSTANTHLAPFISLGSEIINEIFRTSVPLNLLFVRKWSKRPPHSDFQPSLIIRRVKSSWNENKVNENANIRLYVYTDDVSSSSKTKWRRKPHLKGSRSSINRTIKP